MNFMSVAIIECVNNFNNEKTMNQSYVCMFFLFNIYILCIAFKCADIKI